MTKKSTTDALKILAHMTGKDPAMQRFFRLLQPTFKLTHPRRLMTLEELANVAAFMASDKASGMMGTTINLTMGSLDD